MSIFTRRQFINWVEVPEPGKPKPRKVPINPLTGEAIDPHDPTKWQTYQEAVGRGMKVGFVLTDDDPYFFFDLDNCRRADGTWTPEAVAIYQMFPGAAAEISISTTGLHIMGSCRKAELNDRRHKWGTPNWLEFYTTKRFVALGHGFNDGSFDIDWTDTLLRIVPKAEDKTTAALPTGPVAEYTGPADDDELISRMMAARGSIGAQFGTKASAKDLWTGDPSILCQVFPSPSGDTYDRSSADAALMAHLAFWTGKDAARMDRLFRRSALMRPKYAERSDYQRATIGNAISACRSVYNVVKGSSAPPNGNDDKPPLDEFLTAAEQLEYFKGCVYVRDMHRVMIPDGTLLRSEQFNVAYGGKIFAMSNDGTGPTKKAFEAFTENRVFSFPKAKSCCFRPRAEPGALIDGMVNVYFPEHVTTQPGDPAPFLDLLRRLLPDERDRSILLAWCASLVQNPGVKFQWAPVLQGTEGNGKTAIGRCLEYAMSPRYTHIPKAEDLGNQFNAFIENKLLIVVEEIHMQGRRELLDSLKPLITNDRVEVQAKGVDKRMVDNLANWIFFTNHKDAVLKTRDDRRYGVFFTRQQTIDDIAADGMDGDYFPRLYTWFRSGGYAIVAHFLRSYKVPAELDPAVMSHRAPMTSTTGAAITASMGNAEQEVQEAIDSGEAGFRGGWISAYALERLFKDKNIRLSRSKQQEMLEKMGYRQIGRASYVIMQEDGKRPILYLHRSLWNPMFGAADYCAAQGYMTVPNMRIVSTR